jgi:hypothetical protein
LHFYKAGSSSQKETGQGYQQAAKKVSTKDEQRKGTVHIVLIQ